MIDIKHVIIEVRLGATCYIFRDIVVADSERAAGNSSRAEYSEVGSCYFATCYSSRAVSFNVNSITFDCTAIHNESGVLVCHNTSDCSFYGNVFQREFGTAIDPNTVFGGILNVALINIGGRRIFESKVAVDVQATRSRDIVTVQVQRQFLGGTAVVNFNVAARASYISAELNRVAVSRCRQSRTKAIVFLIAKFEFVISLSQRQFSKSLQVENKFVQNIHLLSFSRFAGSKLIRNRSFHRYLLLSLKTWNVGSRAFAESTTTTAVRENDGSHVCDSDIGITSSLENLSKLSKKT